MSATAVMETVGGIFRGFAAALVEGASRMPDKEPPSPTPRTSRRSIPLAVVEQFIRVDVSGRGFDYVTVVREADRAELRVDMRHACGSWQRHRVFERALLADWSAVAALHAVVDAAACYCVRRPEPCRPGEGRCVP